MSTPTTDLSPLEQLMQQKPQEAQQGAPSDLSPLEQLMQMKPAAPKIPTNQASETRQMMVSGLTGMPTPNMNETDKANFETGKAAGAGSATLLSVAPLLGALAPHLPNLDKAWKIAAALGGGSATVDHVLHILGVLNDKKK